MSDEQDTNLTTKPGRTPPLRVAPGGQLALRLGRAERTGSALSSAGLEVAPWGTAAALTPELARARIVS